MPTWDDIAEPAAPSEDGVDNTIPKMGKTQVPSKWDSIAEPVSQNYSIGGTAISFLNQPAQPAYADPIEVGRQAMQQVKAQEAIKPQKFEDWEQDTQSRRLASNTYKQEQVPSELDSQPDAFKDRYTQWSSAYRDAERLTDPDISQQEMVKRERDTAKNLPESQRDMVTAAINDILTKDPERKKKGFFSITGAAYTRGAEGLGSTLKDLIPGSSDKLTEDQRRFWKQIQDSRESLASSNPYPWYDPRAAVVGVARTALPLAAGAALGPAAGAAAFTPEMYAGARDEGYSPLTAGISTVGQTLLYTVGLERDFSQGGWTRCT